MFKLSLVSAASCAFLMKYLDGTVLLLPGLIVRFDASVRFGKYIIMNP